MTTNPADNALATDRSLLKSSRPGRKSVDFINDKLDDNDQMSSHSFTSSEERQDKQ